MYKWVLVSLLVLFVNTGGANEATYVKSIDQWHANREAALKKPTGWLSLAGLFWLKEGVNTLGSDAGCDVVLPDDMPARFGRVTWQDNKLRFQAEPGVSVVVDDQTVTDVVLQTDRSKNTTVLHYGRYQWYVIVRGEKQGIRLKNTAHPNRLSFAGIARFAVDAAWRIPAQFEAYDPPVMVSVPNILGTVSEEPCVGRLRFEVNGQVCFLDPLGDFDDDTWFVIFADETSGTETYGAGRFLVVDRPDSLGVTYLDFNKAYNPPCAFTEFATCPLPPEQNKLSVRILAGEKDYGMHE